MTEQPLLQPQLHRVQSWFVGVDIGGTTVDTLLVDQHYTSHGGFTFPTDLTSPHQTLTAIRDAILHTLNAAGVPLTAVAAIGLGVPGQVDPESGVVNLAVNLNWHHFPAGELLSTQLGVPCFFENDVRAATLGVHRFDNAAGRQNLAYVSIGTGVSAGLILQGRLYRGVHGMAGEFGHILVDPTGPRCNCGAHGCLETFIAGPAIARLGRQAAHERAESLLHTYPTITAKEVYQAAKVGDNVADQIVEQVGAYLGRALQQLLMFYDVESIVLGGGVARAGDAFLQPILHEWERQCQVSALAQTMLRAELLRLADPTQRIGAWGAIAVAKQGWDEHLPHAAPMDNVVCNR